MLKAENEELQLKYRWRTYQASRYRTERDGLIRLILDGATPDILRASAEAIVVARKANICGGAK
jgi:hypothetical protein